VKYISVLLLILEMVLIFSFISAILVLYYDVIHSLIIDLSFMFSMPYSYRTYFRSSVKLEVVRKQSNFILIGFWHHANFLFVCPAIKVCYLDCQEQCHVFRKGENPAGGSFLCGSHYTYRWVGLAKAKTSVLIVPVSAKELEILLSTNLENE
jgi:hypothetical protein